jgi:hypothetical protein
MSRKWGFVAEHQTEKLPWVGVEPEEYTTGGANFLGLILMFGSSTRAIIAILPWIAVYG